MEVRSSTLAMKIIWMEIMLCLYHRNRQQKTTGHQDNRMITILTSWKKIW